MNADLASGPACDDLGTIETRHKRCKPSLRILGPTLERDYRRVSAVP